MNDLEHLARLRDEVPVESSDAAEYALLTEIWEPGLRNSSGRRAFIGKAADRTWTRFLDNRVVRRWGPRPVIAGSLALAIAAGTAVGITVSGSPPARPYPEPVVSAWSGRPTAPLPAAISYGRASTEAQLIDYAGRAAAAASGRAPKPGEWVFVKSEYAHPSVSKAGYLFGPPDQRFVSLQWWRGDGCATASLPDIRATFPPKRIFTGDLTVSRMAECVFGQVSPAAALRSVARSLPTDPAALEPLLATKVFPVRYPGRTETIFEAIKTLLSGGDEGVSIPPKLVVALYRVLHQLPGVTFESAIDLAGRKGLGFSLVEEGYLKAELVINPATYAYMGYKEVAVKNYGHLKKGMVPDWFAQLGTAIVQRPGQLP